ncbi:MAG: 50S ribosomal protein L23, partial [Sandaracinaceae bacterium]|nr:50S ribosomal protein L23 [Sandaracinaceae bacterium]
MNHEQVIVQPIRLTEKVNKLKEEQNKYAFEVRRDANKHQIKAAVEALFNVRVADVNTMIVRGKVVRRGKLILKRQNWKKAIVSLEKGQSIDFEEKSEV